MSETLYADRLLYPVTALGPGQRLALWVAGCPRRCPGCANPELWRPLPKHAVKTDALSRAAQKLLEQKGITRLTITGGEPFEQPAALARFLAPLRPLLEDVLIYTGGLYRELEKDPAAAPLLALADVIIDGPYIQEENDDKTPLRGSANQRVIFLNEALRPDYEAYMAQGRQVQNMVYGSTILSVGIHNRGREQ